MIEGCWVEYILSDLFFSLVSLEFRSSRPVPSFAPSRLQVPEDAQWLPVDHRCHHRWHGQVQVRGGKQLQHQRPRGTAVCSRWVARFHPHIRHRAPSSPALAHTWANHKWRMKTFIKASPGACHPPRQVNNHRHMSDAVAVTWVMGLGRALDLITLHSPGLLCADCSSKLHSHIFTRVSCWVVIFRRSRVEVRNRSEQERRLS